MTTPFLGDTAVPTDDPCATSPAVLDTIITTVLTPIAIMLLFVLCSAAPSAQVGCPGDSPAARHPAHHGCLRRLYTAFRLFTDQSGIFERLQSPPIARPSVLGPTC